METSRTPASARFPCRSPRKRLWALSLHPQASGTSMRAPPPRAAQACAPCRVRRALPSRARLRSTARRSVLSEASLDAAFAAARKRGAPPRALLLTNPHNPTGRCYTPDALRAAVDWAARRGLQARPRAAPAPAALVCMGVNRRRALSLTIAISGHALPLPAPLPAPLRCRQCIAGTAERAPPRMVGLRERARRRRWWSTRSTRGPPPPSHTNRTRRVPHPVLIGHDASLSGPSSVTSRRGVPCRSRRRRTPPRPAAPRSAARRRAHTTHESGALAAPAERALPAGRATRRRPRSSKGSRRTCMSFGASARTSASPAGASASSTRARPPACPPPL
jgi:hypothetical protein